MRRPLLTTVVTLVAVFGLAEVGLRIAGFQNPPADAPMLVWNPAEDVLMADGKYLYRFDEHSLWSPRPGATIQFGERERIDGPPEPVNEDGFRGPRIPLARTPGIVRIASLGDSSTFGLAVHGLETWSALLPVRLADLGVRAEVINAGVEGFTIAQGLEHYRHAVRPYRPDVVIAAFGAINEHFPDAESDAQKIARRRQASGFTSSARRWLRENVRVVQALAHLSDPGASDRFLRAAEQRRREIEFMKPHENDPGWPFGRRIAVEEFAELLSELATEVAADGARLIVVVPPRREGSEDQMPLLKKYTRAAATTAGDRGLQVLAVYSRFRRAHAAGEPVPPLFIGDWWHPSAHGHATIAGWLAPMVADPERNRGRDAGL